MKFKEIEPRRNSVEPELDATPYILSEGEEKTIVGGRGPECGGNLNLCGERGLNSCEPFDCPSKRYSCGGKKTWITESFDPE